MQQIETGAVLLVRVPAAVCAIPLRHVIETMRPLPVSAVPDSPEFLSGVSVIRGVPTPVIDLCAVFKDGQRPRAERFVTLQTAGRVVALAVQGVIGIAEPAQLNIVALPPLLKNARTDVMQEIGTLDADLLVMLQTAALVPEATWKTLGILEATL